MVGASTVKWTIHDPYIGFGESDSNLYINLELFEERNQNIQKNIDLQGQLIPFN